MSLTYPHCQHCVWGHQHHPDNVAGHASPCVLGCAGHEPVEADLFGGAA